MSVSKWAYIPSRCDGELCPGDCDGCSKEEENVALIDGMTKERAITLLDGLRQCYGWGDVIIHSDDAKALTMAIDALERDRWISVEERLPERNTSVLVHGIGNADGFWGNHVTAIAERFLFKFFPSSEGEEMWSSPWQYFHTDYRITHWRPLPDTEGLK